ncbi:TPA: hypothetical protein G9F26_003964 [Salmonella enterica]|uniref:KfrA N-terminal DNA-binding domain-containing protein n=1 Tax=Salmonella enterica TaxID=28901 RepID=A0A750HY78_SALER|nr:hypothetical protein [Salmonella enterica]
MAVAKADVVNACNELYVQGKNVTLDAVRAVTGGSFSTLSPLVKEWKAEQSGVNSSLESGIARSDVPQNLTDLLNTLWTAALATASKQMEAERQLLNDYKTELENECNEVMSSADRLAAELDDLKFEFSCLNVKYNELKENAAITEHENISLRAELKARNKIIANNDSVLGELTQFLKSFNGSPSVNSDAVINNEQKDVSQPENKSVIKSADKTLNKLVKATGKSGNKAPGKTPGKQNTASVPAGAL